jgi:hypothetical protein
MERGEIETVWESPHLRVNIALGKRTILIAQEDSIQEPTVIELDPAQVGSLTSALRTAKRLLGKAGG